MEQQQVAKQTTKIREARTMSISSGFVWEVENWSDIKEKVLQSATIEIPDIDGCFWISLFPRVADDLSPSNDSQSCKSAINFNFKLLSDAWRTNKYEYDVLCSSASFPGGRRSCFSIPSTPIDQNMITKTNIAYMRTPNSLILDFKVNIKYLGSKVIRSKFFDPNALKNDMMMNIRTISGDPTFADFVFLIKGKPFKVHKNILAAASGVMHSMFTSDMEEARTNQCKLDQFEPEVFGKFLECIYNGKPPDDFTTHAMGIYSIADYYGIEKLKELAKNEVGETIDVVNAFEVFKWSLNYGCEEIMTDAWEIMKRDVLKIFFALKKEPLTVDEIIAIMEEKRRSEEFWKAFKS